MDTVQYDSLNLTPEIRKAVQDMGFTEPTEIQQKAIPAMASGADVIAQAPTGTGKTCAFGIPIIEQINEEDSQPQAVILCPTRELSTQICDELRHLAKYRPGIRIAAVYGGQPIAKQINALKKGAHIVVATPGRLLDHMNHRTIDLRHVTTVVLDEADRMLDMGFFKDVRGILDRIPSRKQLAMFSATLSDAVLDIGWIYQRDAIELKVLPIKDSQPKIHQYSIKSVGRQKLADICELLRQNEGSKCIIFCNTKYGAEMVGNQLFDRGFQANFLNGDMRQSERNEIMRQFKSGELPILVATDVAARGIDVLDIDMVINYDMPQDNDTYLHRIGRTGRAKKEGVSYLFYFEDTQKRLDSIIRYTKSNIIPLAFDENRRLVELPR